MGSERLLEAEHIEFWLIDDGPAANPNLEFLVDDAARTIRTLRAEGKKVLVHCVEGSSRTPAQSNTDLARTLRGPRTRQMSGETTSGTVLPGNGAASRVTATPSPAAVSGARLRRMRRVCMTIAGPNERDQPLGFR